MVKKYGEYFNQKFLEVDSEKAAVNNAIRNYSYYKSNIYSIEHYLYSYLSNIINNATLSKMPMITLNYIPKIIKRLTLAYKKAPISMVGEPESKEQELYGKWTRNLNKFRKEFHRQGKLFNTILVRPIINEDKEYFDYLILNRGLCEVETDPRNHQKMLEVEYQVPDPREGKEKEDITIHWTETEYYATDKNGKRITNIKEINGKNPYGVIPFVVLRMEDTNEFFGDGLSDLVKGNEHLNGRLTDTFFKLYMSFGIPVGTNLNIKSDEFFLSPDTPIMIDNARQEMLNPSLEFVTPEQKVELDKLVNDWFINEMGVIKGLPAGAFAELEKATSGYSKMIDNLELIDLNEDDKEVLYEFEYDLFEMQKKVLEVEQGLVIKGDLNFEFMPIDFPKSDTEIWLNREKEFQYNISTPVDWLREYRPQGTDEELNKVLKDNQKTNSEMKRTLTRLESLVNGTAPQNNF